MNTRPNFQMYRQDLYLLIILIMMAVTIIIKSYFNFHGYISPDSSNYLMLAQNLLDENGYFVSSYANTGNERDFFAIWPVGYPTLIFFTAKLTGFSVFWASKFLNIFLIGIILGIFRLLFKQNAYVYGLILLFSAYIEIFSYTWSETLFITALLWFTTSIYFFIENPKQTTLLYFSIILSALLLFMSRYIGAFSFGFIGLLGIYYGAIKKEKLKSIILIAIAVIDIGIMFLYLYHNYNETGFLTGTQRVPSQETNLELLISLTEALIAEITIPKAYISFKWFALQWIALILIVAKYRKSVINMITKNDQNAVRLSKIFLLIGCVYLFFIILMRWITQFDEYSYRLLAPGSFLLFIGLIFFIQQRATKQFFDVFKVFLLLFSMLSYFLDIRYSSKKIYTPSLTYNQILKGIHEKYKDVEKDSVIVFAPIHISYLYTNMQERRPYSFSYNQYREKWSDFLKRINPQNTKNIYIDIPEIELTLKEYDPSVVAFVKQYDKGTLVKIQ